MYYYGLNDFEPGYIKPFVSSPEHSLILNNGRIILGAGHQDKFELKGIGESLVSGDFVLASWDGSHKSSSAFYLMVFSEPINMYTSISYRIRTYKSFESWGTIYGLITKMNKIQNYYFKHNRLPS